MINAIDVWEGRIEEIENINEESLLINIETNEVEVIKKCIFNEKKFKGILDLFNKNLIDENLEFVEINPQSILRNQDDKNLRHGITNEEYIRIMESIVIEYEKKIKEFFSNNRNMAAHKIYKRTAASFNDFLFVNRNNCNSIIEFVLIIKEQMYSRFRNELEEYEDEFIEIILYHMYYICDLDVGKGRTLNVIDPE